MKKVFLNQKEALIEEYKECDEATKAVVAKLNHLYAEQIMDIMKSHDVKEIILYDESMGEYFPEFEWRDFSEINAIEDLETKEVLIRYLEESDEAFNVVEEHPELLALEEE